MRTKKQNRDEIRNSVVTFTVTPAENALIEKNAYEKGMSKSTFLRVTIFEKLKEKEGK